MNYKSRSSKMSLPLFLQKTFYKLKSNPSLFLIFLILIFFLSYIVHSSIPQISSQTTSFNSNSIKSYAVVVDAGSTGSRVHIYTYDNSDKTTLIKVKLDEREPYKKFYPGLSSFETNPSDINAIGKYLDPLIEYSREYISISDRNNTYFYVLASAGMRSVSERNEQTAKLIMDNVYQYLYENCEYIVERQYIKIVRGVDEGIWGWVVANYLNNELQNSLIKNSVYKASTNGVLEMGGESLQITFVPSENIINYLSKNENVIYLNLFNIHIPIFTHSYNHIGMQAAQKKYDTYLIENGQVNESPCYIVGDIRNRDKSKKQYSWKGKGNFEECLSALKSIINNKDKLNCENENNNKDNMVCVTNGLKRPKIYNEQPFYYIENFYYTAKVLGINNINSQTWLTKLREHGQQYCSLNKNEVKIKYPNIEDSEIPKTCFCAAYLTAIIEDGFKLDKYTNFKIIRDINNIGIDWVLGFLIHETANQNMNYLKKQKITKIVSNTKIDL